MTVSNLVETRSGLTHERLREVLRYCPETGEWTWLKTLSDRAPAGSPAGAPSEAGYIRIGVDGARYRAHRLAWFYMTGEWPSGLIDHRDTDRANNRWTNLRLSTTAQNGANMRLRTNNTSGFKGVFWSTQQNKWAAKITVNRRQVHLGYYDDIEAAAEAYRLGALRHFGEFARAA